MNEVPTNPGIKPLGNLVLLDVSPRDKKLASGIVLPTAVQGNDTKREAVIVTKGPDCTRADLKGGMSVYVGNYSSNEIQREGRKYRLALEKDILAELEEVGPIMPEAAVTPIQPH
jgi:co-chaperonin GroES (HSP10)